MRKSTMSLRREKTAHDQRRVGRCSEREGEPNRRTKGTASTLCLTHHAPCLNLFQVDSVNTPASVHFANRAGSGMTRLGRRPARAQRRCYRTRRRGPGVRDTCSWARLTCWGTRPRCRGAWPRPRHRHLCPQGTPRSARASARRGWSRQRAWGRACSHVDRSAPLTSTPMTLRRAEVL